ncbi:hypothetical protein H8356DRAFT_1420983 [Neocallimastix lanati (nom. inval.)]|nr:hypothetical protein H8356DRAFT_1420983 [Neocallimastix sp. JGI-2020a]
MGATLQPFILLIKNLLLHLYRRVTEYNLLLGGRDADVVDLNYKKEWILNRFHNGDFIKSFPKMPYYSWIKESRTLYKKIKKYKCVKYDDILERYWKSVSKFQGIKGQNYDSNKFSNNKAIIMLSLKYPQFNLGFSWIIHLRCEFNNLIISGDYSKTPFLDLLSKVCKVSEKKRLTEVSNDDLMILLERQQKEQQERLKNGQSVQIANLMSSTYEKNGEQEQLTETFNSNPRGKRKEKAAKKKAEEARKQLEEIDQMQVQQNKRINAMLEAMTQKRK